MNSQSVFFNNTPRAKRRFSRGLIRAITAVAATTLPQLSARVAKKFLANANGKRRVLFEQATPVAEYTAPTKRGNAQLYQFGEGNNHVLFTHGWADSTQGMEKVIIRSRHPEPLARLEGFSAVGRSGSRNWRTATQAAAALLSKPCSNIKTEKIAPYELKLQSAKSG